MPQRTFNEKGLPRPREMSENGHVLPRSSSLALLLQELVLDQVLLDFAHLERERDPVPPENAIETAQSLAFPRSGSR